MAQALDALGWTTLLSTEAEGAEAAVQDLPLEAAVVVLDGTADFASLPRRLRQAAHPRRLPVVALAEPGPALDALGFDLVLAPPAHPAQIAARLETLVRAAVSEEEFELRAQTLAARGAFVQPPAGAEGPGLQVLTVGEPAPKFLALAHALAEGGAEVTAALTAYTAFDYLHERAFDAVVLWTGQAHAEALSIAGGMRRNTRLYHIPTVLYGRQGVEVGLDEAFAKGLSDVAHAEVAPAAAAGRILSLARAHRRAQALRDALSAGREPGLMDAATGLFTRDLFAAHLGRLARDLPARRRALSVAVLRAAPRALTSRMVRDDGWFERAMPQIGSMIGRLVRVEDTAARLSADVFALALPGSRLAAAQAAAERIAAVIGCTAFEAGADRPPFTVEFAVGAAELMPGESPATALERAAEGGLRRAG
ncbi:MAG: diguanylate cyclase [Caulobacteraceae bacterium]|nr:diguanylate cyclase [Caulobacter sp.]